MTAEARRMKQRRTNLALGLPTSSKVDAEPARRHVKALQRKGMGWQRVAHHAGLHPSSVEGLLYGRNGYGPWKRIHRDAADRLLGVRLDVADLGRMDGTGTRRRLRALVALGWTSRVLADRLGWSAGNFATLINGRRLAVSGATERKVRVLYDELWDVLPPEVTADQRRSASRSRSLARRRGWVSPLAWDDHRIDDPKARPDIRGRRVAS